MTEKKMNEIRKNVLNMKRIGNLAIHEVLETNRKLGIPSVFSRNGKIFYEMPDGSIKSSI